MAKRSINEGSGKLDRFTVGDYVIYIALALAALICVAPVVNICAISFSASAAAVSEMPSCPAMPSTVRGATEYFALTFFAGG